MPSSHSSTPACTIPSRLLIIGYVWPEPRSSAAGSHILNLLKLFLQEGWQLTFASPAATTDKMADLETLGIDTRAIELNNSSFDDFIGQLEPDMVLFDRFMMEEQFGWRVEQACPQALRILDTEDLFCLRHARHDRLKQQLKDDKAHKTETANQISAETSRELVFTELAQREIAAIHRCDLALIISQVEMKLLTELFKVDASLLHYTPFSWPGIEPRQVDALPCFEQRQDFISIGNFRHPPNWDAVLWLKETIWPLIRKQLPQAQLHIYGAYTPPKATALHNPKQGFLIQGWAEDAFAVMRQARVNLAPLRFGAGLKGKIADAMECGTPSITTAIGTEGLVANNNNDSDFAGDIGNNPAAIANAAVALYQDCERWRQKQAQGFDTINQHFNRQQHQQGLIDKVQQLRGSLAAHRLNNFTGAMLRHHHHKSTQYMSQWIEEKNKHST